MHWSEGEWEGEREQLREVDTDIKKKSDKMMARKCLTVNNESVYKNNIIKYLEK